jgi:nucleotide-binding universal stress UspA family protein/nitrite reductase/ring-hydroxylating ferredoxin subunit
VSAPSLTYRTIIAGTDGSATARIAERTACLLARATDARLLLASAYRDSAGPADAVLEDSLGAAREIWPNVDTRVARGEPAEALVTLAVDEQADLLVLGNKGMTGRVGFLLGSVPDKVSHNAPCDLLIVRTSPLQDRAREQGRDGAGDLDGGRGPGIYRKVLLATDASQTSLQAVRRGFDIATRIGAMPVLFYGGHPKTAEIVFGEVAREFLPAAMLQTASAEGDPADAICGAAEREDYDLIVLGNKGMLGGRFRIGVVPNKVSHQAPTDLLIVRTTGASIADLAPGDGAVVKDDGETVAAYRDADGAVHLLSARCTHMGCTVGWNGDDRTWDCPCHGSRYGLTGNVIRGPAADALAPIDRT